MTTVIAPESAHSHAASDGPLLVCRLENLEPNLGAAVLLPGGRQIALFRYQGPAADGPAADGSAVYALSNIDPYTGAAVMSRGIVGEHGGHPTVASPLLKQPFRLDTGVSMVDPDHRLETVPVTVTDDGAVYLFAGPATESVN